MAILPSAYESPRIENGTVRFYRNDTFEVDLTINVTDNNGLPVTLLPDDMIDIIVTSCRGEVLVERHYTGADLTGNVLTIPVDRLTSESIHPGRHKYDIYLTHDGDRTTIVKGNLLEVM